MSTYKHNILKIAVIMQLLIILCAESATAQPLGPNFQTQIQDITGPLTIQTPEFHADRPKPQGAHRANKPGRAVKPKKQS